MDIAQTPNAGVALCGRRHTLPGGTGRTRRKSLAALAGAAALALLAAACSSSGTSGTSATTPNGFRPGVLDHRYAGSTITVLLPPWGQMPKSQLAQFTEATGITVKLENLAWDSIHDKVVSSEAANTAPADITELDWSWVGQFAAAGWYTALGPYLPRATITGSPVAPVFSYRGAQIAMPYNIDFRGMVLNMTDFNKAGITTVPTTWAQVLADARQIKAKGVVTYPVGVPLSVTEGTSTPWYALVKSSGGQLLTSTGGPAFDGLNTPGGQALVFEQTLYKDGLVPPGEVGLTDQQTSNLFAAGQVAMQLSFGPGAVATYLDPAQAKVAKDDIVFAAMPGNDGTRTGTFGLPEGLGIPRQSTHKAQAALFIYWWEQRPQLLVSYANPSMGNLPPQTSALTYLAQHGKLADGESIVAILPTVEPLFPQGTPVWYPQFSTDAAAMIQSVVEGKATPGSALAQLASQVKTLQAQS